ncbi:MAG: T9SS type A sorting domain-containing protein [Flavobacteriaceae bacterium]|nr:T9SS type A sorting domain-containing protein [Flavobacteriaceae bacterium]
MKKFTLLILLLMFAVSFGQQPTVKTEGNNNPIHYNQQQKKQTVVKTQKADSRSEAKSNGANNPISLKKVKQTSNDGNSSFDFGNSATTSGNVTPLHRNLIGTTSLSASKSTWGSVMNPPAGTASRNMQSDFFYKNLAPVVITHSVSQSIVPGSITCNAGGIPDENSFYRDFDLANDFGIANDFDVSSVEFGVEQITGPVALTLNIYSTAGPFPSGFPGSLTLKGTANYTVTLPDNLTIVSVPLNATIPAGAIMVYEMKINLGATNSFFPGSNSAGQTGVSWIAAAACGITTPTDLGAIGFPNVHMIMNVVGEEAGGGGGGACGSPILEVNQDVDDTCMANITQTGLAQSYIPTAPISAGAGIKFRAASTGLNVNLSLWDGLPNAAGTMLASGTSQTDGTVWTDVFWDPVVNVTVGTTYYIVIDGDVSLPCIAGALNNPYPGGNVFANAGYTPFPNYDYTFRTYSCDSGGGGSGPCNSSVASNGFEDGRGCSINNNWTVANDIVVAAGNDAMLNSIIPNVFMNPGATANSVDVIIWSDAGGFPGTAISTQLGVVPTSQTVLGSNYGFNISAVTMDLSPVPLPGDAGSDTTYWISIQVTTSDGGNAYWEDSTASSIGNPLAFNDGTGWIIPDPAQDGVYTFIADCTPIGGGGGGPCSEENPNDFTFEDGLNCSSAAAFKTANDVTVAADENFTLTNITASIFANGGIANVDVYYYSDSAGLPGTQIGFEPSVTIDSQTVIGNNFGLNVNEVKLTVPPFMFAGQAGVPTTYWIQLSVADGGGTGAVYWVITTSTSVGNPTAQFNGGWSIYDPTYDGVYIWEGNCEPIGGGGSYDDCSGAIALACGDSVVGETLTATDSGGNPAPDVFYKFTGSGTPQLVTISLCGGGTDYDSVLRIFDDCDLLNQLAFNDDFCGLQSEVTFVSDGTSTYYIMVEGFSSSSGNFSLDVTCGTPLPNDGCSGAIAVSCGDSVSGTTVGATTDSGTPACGPAITSPGVWYTLDDNSGLPGNITLSLCNGTNFDSKISVYTGSCSALVCVGGNDDACGLQSEITFATDGNTKFYILIHSFGGATGNFTMDVICTPTPPPNDMIVNSIDVDEIGFPYTDPAVNMPAATTENGNPAGCDLTGANGVWYNFVPFGDGTANAMIVTPGGASSVTFYTAPSENATETDLTLVPQQTNQCAPGTSASIYTLAGQAYYVFVLNTGAITDIKIDGTNLGVADNTIAGFSYYPNPTNGILNLNSIDNIENVSLYNILGQVLINNRVDATTSQLDISGLKTGTYLMKVTVNGQTGTYRVLKQ